MDLPQPAYWNSTIEELLHSLDAKPEGLTDPEAHQRLRRYGGNRLQEKKRIGIFTLLIAQFKTPIVLMLLFAAILSFFLHNPGHREG